MQACVAVLEEELRLALRSAAAEKTQVFGPAKSAPLEFIIRKML